MKTIAACLVLFLLCTLSQAAEQPQPTREQAQFFETKVRPLLASRCHKCHGASKQQGMLRLDSRAAVLAGGESGPAVEPGKPQESRLIQAINYAGPEMPPDGKLGKRDIDVLTTWVKMGAPWPNEVAGSSPKAKSPAVSAGEITEKDRLHWSFQSIVRPRVPHLVGDDRAANPIDAFVLQKLKAAGLAPSPPASPRELVRRAYFDLIGLPPTPEEVAAFLADDSPRAYETLIDRLLARPQYGERWGRHWLDLVRYAQSNGYERDDEKPFAWRYRDYVIRALNEDKPYDRFILEQLAGDELSDVTHDSIIATGFCRLGVWDDEPDDKVVALWDEIDDVLRTTGETFLGLTIGCARCHEHKFDPIPQEDYYRLAAFFRNIAPYGKDKSDTHWQLNPAAIYTLLATPEVVSQAKEHKRKTAQIEALKKRLGELRPGKEAKKLQDQIGELESSLDDAFDRARALSVREAGPVAPKTHVFIRGNPLSPGKEVVPAFLTVLDRGTPAIEPLGANNAAASGNELRDMLRELGVQPTSGRRLALARWVASKDNPLTARVIANRLWHYHFGRGLVSTPSDFGRQGLPPSHPELLDWLASELTGGGWRLKRMHKLIMLSGTYRQSSRVVHAARVPSEVDPDNKLLWRQNLHRLDAEAIRDSVLAVSGGLNLTMGGRGVFPELSKEVLSTQSKPGDGWDKSSPSERARRSVYIFVKRTLTVPLMDAFDQPTPDKPNPARTTTTIAPQALMLLNSTFMDQQSTAFADRLLRECADERAKQIERAFDLALARAPSHEEKEIALAFLDRRTSEFNVLPANETKDLTANRHALNNLCRMIFNLNEFVYVD
jgi:cytochrome c553